MVFIVNSFIQKKIVLVFSLYSGEMPYGAGRFAAAKYGAAEIVDPRPYLHGSLNRVFQKYPHLGKLIPAMGYWPEQIKDLEATINAVPCDTVLIATPMDLRKVINVEKPAAVSTYGVEDREQPYLSEEIEKFVKEVVKGTKANGGIAAS